LTIPSRLLPYSLPVLMYFYRMKTSFFAAILIFFLAACKENNPASSAESKDTADSTKTAKVYFPVLDFLKGEIRDVDSFASGIRKYTTINNKTDSGFIKPASFKAIAGEFLGDDLKKENFEKNYKESSFFDQTTQSYTFTYSTENRDLAVQRVDVLVNPGEGFDKVKSVYLEKHSENKDSSVLKKMYWKAGESFMINSQIIIGSSDPVMKQEKVVWKDWN
jgi:hypothetical protein